VSVDTAERRRRNYVIAGAVGGLLLPLAGIVGAMVFYSRDDREAAYWVAGASVAGLLAYVILFALL
jgi:zinc transporter ZupT